MSSTTCQHTLCEAARKNRAAQGSAQLFVLLDVLVAILRQMRGTGYPNARGFLTLKIGWDRRPAALRHLQGEGSAQGGPPIPDLSHI